MTEQSNALEALERLSGRKDHKDIIREALTQQGWQPIETAPKNGRRVLLLTEKYGASTGNFDGNVWLIHSCLNQDAGITHWQPLP